MLAWLTEGFEMRTTLEIRDEVLAKVKEYAAARSISRGAAVSDMLERGFNAPVATKWENGFLVFDPGPNAEIVSLQRTLELEDELENELG
jgi:hypothetical protein